MNPVLRSDPEETRRLTGESDSTLLLGAIDEITAHVALLGHQGEVLAVNRAWVRFAEANGYADSAAAVGASYLAVCDQAVGAGADDAHRVAAGLRSVLAGEAEEFQLEYSCHAPWEERRFTMRARRVGRPGRIAAVVTHESVTEQWLAQRAAQEARREEERARQEMEMSEALFRSLTERSLELVAILEQDGRIRYVNASVQRTLGVAPGALRGLALRDLVHPDDVVILHGAHVALTADGPGAVTEFAVRLRHQDGSWRWFEGGVQNLLHEPAVRGLTINARDVTERVRAEQRNRFQARLLDAIDQAAIATDATGVITYWNRAAQRIYGWTANEVLGRSILDVTVPVSGAADGSEIMAQLAAGRSWTGEFMVRRKDGAHFIALVTNSPVFDAAGSLSAIIGISVDVSAQKAAEREREALLAQLAEERGRLAAIVQQMPCAVIIAEAPSGRLVLGNPLIERIFGHPLLPSAGIEAYREWKGYHPDGRPIEPHEWPLSRAVAHGEVTSGEVVRYPRPDEPNAWLRLSAAPIRDRTGVIVAGVVTAEDITTQINALAALRESEARYRLVGRVTKDSIWDWDIAAGTIQWSDARSDVYGHEQDDATSMHIDMWAAAVHPDDVKRVVESLNAVITGTESEWSAEYRYRKSNGAFVEVLDRGHVLRDDAGQATRMIGAMVELTERRALEAQLRQAQKMEAVGRLAGGVAHDFNNLLGVMTSYAGMLLEDLPADTPSRDDVREIQAAIDRAAALTTQLLAYSRQQVLQPQRIDLRDVVRGTKRMLERVIGEDITLVTDCEEAPSDVMADAGQIEQVILNLAVNARDAMPTGGVLHIAVANRILHPEAVGALPGARAGRYAVLLVSDSGAGMDAETRQRIFDPFFTTKALGKGTGLGLATVYGIVKQSEGYITVASVPGRGSTFRIFLPLTDTGPDTTGEVAAVARAVHGAGATLLVVEDEPALRSVTERILRKRGYHVLTAANGQEALDIITRRAEPIHALVTDVVMPAMSGQELVQRIEALHGPLPTLFMSGYAMEAVVSHGVLRPGAPLLRKPVKPDDLVAAVDDLLAGRGAATGEA